MNYAIMIQALQSRYEYITVPFISLGLEIKTIIILQCSDYFKTTKDVQKI